MVASPWFHVVPRPGAAASPRSASRRLYCFPYAGGALSTFRPLASHIRHDVELCFVSLPGRGPRLAEPPEDDLRNVVSSLAGGIMESGARDFVFFGHSMGALLSFEVARELRRRGGSSPAGLVVSGARAPQFAGSADGERRHSDLPREELIEHLRSLGGTPPEVLDFPELMDLLLPALRADFKIYETYRYVAESPLSSPLMVLLGEEDAEVRPEQVAAWRPETTSDCTIRSFPGGHFFILRHWPELGRVLNGLMDRVWADGCAASWS
jgi:medium-chain acyl-[acyl-carrier-protein] hydrolase